METTKVTVWIAVDERGDSTVAADDRDDLDISNLEGKAVRVVCVELEIARPTETVVKAVVPMDASEVKVLIG